jgi:DNA mismatch repair protein MutS2
LSLSDAGDFDRTHSDKLMVVAEPFSRAALDFPAVGDLLRGYLSGPIGRPLAEGLSPRTDLDAIRRDLELVGEAQGFVREGSRPSFSSLPDPRPILAKLGIESLSLTPQEILALLELARVSCDLRDAFQETPYSRLDALASALADFRSLVKSLDGKILPDGTLDSSASAELARIRRSIERLRHEVQITLERLLRKLSHDEVVQDAVVTLRNDRFVIPVRAEAKRRVPGVVHGSSSSGASVFIEPLETLPLNNELVELQDHELAEIQRLLAEFTRCFASRSSELAAAAGILGELDLAFAKAEFARAYDCCLPEFVAERALSLRDVRHPLLEKTLRAQKQRPVPLTLEVASPQSLVVISGPNTGGKTVALKTVGMAVLMAQAALPVPAAEARLPVFGRVLADIGDQQSIEASLSTFSAHVQNIQAMVEVAEKNDLVLLDEIGASTEPNEGAALAVAILEHFRQNGAMTFVTTHHSRLKAYAAERLETLNAAMEFDEATLAPTYRLLVGLPGKSSGIDTAERLGLRRSIVERARQMLAPAEAESSALVASLHEQKAEMDKQIAAVAQERHEIEAEHKRLEEHFIQERHKRLAELDAKLEETLRRYDAKWEKKIEEIRAQALAQARPIPVVKKSKAAELARETREEWNAEVLEVLGGQEAEKGPADTPPEVGDQVRVSGLSTPGRIVALAGDEEVDVEVGRMRMRVPRSEVRVLAKKGEKPAVGAGASRMPLDESTPEGAAEINVIGTTAEEARELVDKFLDEAYLARRYRLRVVHGHGKGILRRSLHEMFAEHPHVDKFYAAPQNEGGSGATIVELKL